MSAGQSPVSHSAAEKDTRARRRELAGTWDAVTGDRCEVSVVKDKRPCCETLAVSMAFGLGLGSHGSSYPVLLLTLFPTSSLRSLD